MRMTHSVPWIQRRKKWKTNNVRKLTNNVRTNKNAIRTNNNLSVTVSVKIRVNKTANHGL